MTYLLAFLLTFFPIACVAFALDYIIDNKTNHTSVSYLYVTFPLLFCVLISLLLYKIKKEKFRRFITPIVVNILAIVFFVSIDHFNIMVQYDEWTRRGMPGRFEKSNIRGSEYPKELEDRVMNLMNALVDGKITREEYDREIRPLVIEMEKAKEAYYKKKMPNSTNEIPSE
ncbi:MAG: hypothetical protein FWD67_05045 [Betaproteobacteria bacterium]|nr:hypothetical protein [Betaproteobacteria bacterium]